MIAALAWRAAIAAVVWWALAEGDVPTGAGLPVAILAVAVATAASMALRLPGGARPRLAALPRFVAFFLWQSATGGLDVARRALGPAGAVDPDIVELRPELPAGAPWAVFVEVVSVMPGTLVVGPGTGGSLRVHVIAGVPRTRESLAQVEREVARLFGLHAATGERRGRR